MMTVNYISPLPACEILGDGWKLAKIEQTEFACKQGNALIQGIAMSVNVAIALRWSGGCGRALAPC
jgi:hypothetical protein